MKQSKTGHVWIGLRYNGELQYKWICMFCGINKRYCGESCAKRQAKMLAEHLSDGAIKSGFTFNRRAWFTSLGFEIELVPA